MTTADLLADAFGRIHGIVHRVLDGLTAAQLAERLDSQANTIAWLIWHLARVQDNHLADAANKEELWISQGWSERFNLPFDRHATGYGQNADEVGTVVVQSVEPLADYFDAVHESTMNFVRQLDDDELDRIVDDSWDPPVSLGVRLISVVSDNLQHAGQAAFIRGIVENR